MRPGLLSHVAFLLLIARLSTLAQAQILYPVKGTVRDSATGHPLERAAVVIDYEKGTLGAYTDEQGQF
ncbi:MAG TPA: hypothetical protein VK404_19530, partial [Spirosoma sp.]|nr:hypothetical protein [Spirosoma sp.]